MKKNKYQVKTPTKKWDNFPLLNAFLKEKSEERSNSPREVVFPTSEQMFPKRASADYGVNLSHF